MLKLFALLSVLLGGAAAAPLPSPAPRPTTSPSPAAVSPDQLFSRRALRRARLLIQMRLLQLHDERLECVRQALLRRLPGALWPEEPSPSRGTPDAATAIARCDELLRL
jgi:hypothetical protein